jgi:putative thioredoxin
MAGLSMEGTVMDYHQVWSEEMIDVTDDTFESAVVERSDTVPVVVDLWAPWCGPCQTLGPMIERAVEATGGAVELAKVNVDENPMVSATFRVQSIPAVFALKDRRVIDSFIGAVPKAAVDEFVSRLVPVVTEADRLVEAGDEASLRRALELEPDHPAATLALAELLIGQGAGDEALSLLARLPETAEVRRVAALARLGSEARESDGLESRLGELLDRVKEDETARQEFVDLLETMGPDDPRTAPYRRALTARLF